ncbi:hypothetical protein B0H66DRAFT_165574 [Apodospora peruviana]|uniref:NB-ARC domain-containing protein n=1 Tax=Apodospora peruviana TaxID=516989 RepID=A0AAE0IKI1_9PEZI|nr:hypothetical protein B0H66DRAFT_165574 [Apodospora peruviana]
MKLFYSQPGESGKANLAHISECSHGSVLVTTRDKQLGLKLTEGKQLIEVGKMSEDESEELLREKLTEVDVEPAQLSRLSSRLEFLTLALAQAAAFIQENMISVNQYLELIDKSDQHTTKLFAEEVETVGRDSDTPRAVASTWILLFE